jgi:hexosaminidase
MKILLMITMALTTAVTATAGEISVIPQPVTLTRAEGGFLLRPDTKLDAPAPLERLAAQLRDDLGAATGFSLPSGKRGSNVIVLKLDPGLKSIGSEGYRLSVTPKKIEISSSRPNGIFYGIQTLRQLLPSAIYRKAPVQGTPWQIPAVTVEDYPRFSWRGGHLDVGRHFMPKEFLFKYVDLLALHKLNVFHLHLTEDQGWRIEIKKYPRLTEIGAWRKDTMLKNEPAVFEGKPHGGFYTQEDLRELVAYARDRFVNIVPEIEMPGHSQAAVAAYPQLGNTGEPLEVATRWGVIEHVYSPEDATIAFLKDVLTEVMAIFPSEFIHVGGDEVPKKQWKESARAQARIKELGLKTEEELQSWFIRQIDTFLASKGRRLVGWDEILEGGLAPGATVMSWRGEKGGIEAAKQGHDVVMTPTGFTYFDYYQAKDRAAEPPAIGGFLPLDRVYGFEPIPGELTGTEVKRVLGAQFQIWTEYIPDPKQAEYMAYPRACALSEVVWSPRAARNLEDFMRRLPAHLERLKILDVNFRKPEFSTPPASARNH